MCVRLDARLGRTAPRDGRAVVFVWSGGLHSEAERDGGAAFGPAGHCARATEHLSALAHHADTQVPGPGLGAGGRYAATVVGHGYEQLAVGLLEAHIHRGRARVVARVAKRFGDDAVDELGAARVEDG